MKFNLLASVAGAAVLGGFVGIAQAADLTPEPTPFDWSGLYIGAHIGYGEAFMDGCIECSSSSVGRAERLNLDGVTGGLHGGYNLQFDNNIVGGIEADISFNDWSDRENTSSVDAQSAKVDTLGTVRLRLGYAIDDTLIFASGGLAFTDAEWTNDRDGTEDTAHLNDLGGVVGGGLEHMITDNVSLRAEGFYYFFDDTDDISGFSEGSPGNHVRLDDMYVVRAGVTFHFNGT